MHETHLCQLPADLGHPVGMHRAAAIGYGAAGSPEEKKVSKMEWSASLFYPCIERNHYEACAICIAGCYVCSFRRGRSRGSGANHHLEVGPGAQRGRFLDCAHEPLERARE